MEIILSMFRSIVVLDYGNVWPVFAECSARKLDHSRFSQAQESNKRLDFLAIPGAITSSTKQEQALLKVRQQSHQTALRLGLTNWNIA